MVDLVIEMLSVLTYERVSLHVAGSTVGFQPRRLLGSGAFPEVIGRMRNREYGNCREGADEGT